MSNETTRPYFRPVRVSDVKLHGDYNCLAPTASVLRVDNLFAYAYPPVIKCIDENAWQDCTGFAHTTDAYIRSWLMLYKTGLHYRTEELNWSSQNELCEQAYFDNQRRQEYHMSFEYDTLDSTMFEVDHSKHYEFDMPEELLLMIPVDLGESQYEVLPKDVRHKFIDHLAYRYLMTTLPIHNIEEVDNI